MIVGRGAIRCHSKDWIKGIERQDLFPPCSDVHLCLSSSPAYVHNLGAIAYSPVMAFELAQGRVEVGPEEVWEIDLAINDLVASVWRCPSITRERACSRCLHGIRGCWQF